MKLKIKIVLIVAVLQLMMPAATGYCINGSTSLSGSKNGMVLYKRDADTIELYSLLPDGKVLKTAFYRKAWGTWNIGEWSLASDGKIPSGKTQLLAGGGTDWEYVFRVSESPYVQAQFSGGNHGKEALRSMKLFNGSDNSPLNPAAGQKIPIDSLKIVEENSLTFDFDQTRKYADVTRIYYIQPSSITLEAVFNFTRDAYMGASYVAMFPVSKAWGRHAEFSNTGLVLSSPKWGETLTRDGFESFLGCVRTLSVELWGDTNPKYRFRSWIADEGMVDGFRNELKVFLWDCNKGGNKLYFSRYDNSYYSLVQSGTRWHHRQGWALNVQR